MQSHPYRILLIEDNAADVYLLKQALCADATCDVTVIPDGDKAFRHLESLQGAQAEAQPDLVVLDLNLPGKDGSEILELIRGTPETRHLPVAIVSSSPRDVLQKKAAHADCYITKPADLDDYLALGKELLKCAAERGRIPPSGNESERRTP